MDFLNLNGEIETLTFKEIKRRTNKNISWAGMNELNKHKGNTPKSTEIFNFIKKYVGEVCVFDFNNLMEYEHLFLYPHFVELALKNGAIDKR